MLDMGLDFGGNVTVRMVITLIHMEVDGQIVVGLNCSLQCFRHQFPFEEGVLERKRNCNAM